MSKIVTNKTSFNSRLREEATTALRRFCTPGSRFNSRLREEATHKQFIICDEASVSTHASVRRRPDLIYKNFLGLMVSTHASVRRRRATNCGCASGSCFNSRLREEATFSQKLM